ncbi:helix-turn-helix protein [Herbihabitans rhizosphaerae]|uniref:Helix-turn-helix protein n=1 Tax=Herbihabitans rhizosphaerae TaxID=1872711 RepID=A0A4Q7L3L6_9PSEU|nr:helix-turn-helix transcriptional regulator [Herbihabitans rhizosphaerae]RZS43827.1 helix-turn-helix protein [Herbihabitans rhizosphaerae]
MEENPVLLRAAIGEKLRVAREAVGMKMAEAAPLLDCSESRLCRIEQGHGLDVHFVRTAMDVYNLVDDTLLDEVRRARNPGWWKEYGISDKDYIALESGASVVSTYAANVVHGLLQTADYARMLFESRRRPMSEEWIAKQLTVRLIRQERLTDEDQPLQLHAVLDEHMLHRPIKRPELMRTQLDHLALISELPSVDIRVLPAETVANEALLGSFTVLDFLQHERPSIAQVEHPLCVERKRHRSLVRFARVQFEHVRSLALDPVESTALIERLADDWAS